MNWYLPSLLILPALLAGCGGKAPPTLSVTCDGDRVLAGAESIEVLGPTAASGALLSYPDPANSGKTGTIAIKPGSRCGVALTGNN